MLVKFNTNEIQELFIERLKEISGSNTASGAVQYALNNFCNVFDRLEELEESNERLVVKFENLRRTVIKRAEIEEQLKQAIKF